MAAGTELQVLTRLLVFGVWGDKTSSSNRGISSARDSPAQWGRSLNLPAKMLAGCLWTYPFQNKRATHRENKCDLHASVI